MAREIREYTVVCGNRLEEFIRKCNSLLHIGWEPLGGVNKGEYEWFQSFTKTSVPKGQLSTCGSVRPEIALAEVDVATKKKRSYTKRK